MPGKGRPVLGVRVDKEFIILLRIEARKHRTNLPTFVRAIVEAYLRGVGGVNTPPGGLSESTMRKAVMAKLRGLLGQLRFEIATLDVPAIREKRVNELSQAIENISEMGRSAEPEDRLRIYQLLGYLCMVLDGILNNVTKGEMLRRLEAVEARLDVGVEGDREAPKRRRRKDSASKQ